MSDQTVSSIEKYADTFTFLEKKSSSVLKVIGKDIYLTFVGDSFYWIAFSDIIMITAKSNQEFWDMTKKCTEDILPLLDDWMQEEIIFNINMFR